METQLVGAESSLEPGQGGAQGVVEPPKPVHGGRWKKGQCGRVPKELPPDDPAVPELLRDLRHVRTQNKKQDRTPSRRQLRTLAEKDQKTFLAMWKEEERLFAESQRSKDGAEERAVADGGTVKCLELVERLLSEFEGGSR